MCWLWYLRRHWWRPWYPRPPSSMRPNEAEGPKYKTKTSAGSNGTGSSATDTLISLGLSGHKTKYKEEFQIKYTHHIAEHLGHKCEMSHFAKNLREIEKFNAFVDCWLTLLVTGCNCLNWKYRYSHYYCFSNATLWVGCGLTMGLYSGRTEHFCGRGSKILTKLLEGGFYIKKLISSPSEHF